MKPNTRLYFTAHIIVEPPEDITFGKFQNWATAHGWNAAMYPGKWSLRATGSYSSYLLDSIHTAQGSLEALGYKVIRAVFADVLLDTDAGDVI